MITELAFEHRRRTDETLEEARDTTMWYIRHFRAGLNRDETIEDITREANQYVRENYPYLFDEDVCVAYDPNKEVFYWYEAPHVLPEKTDSAVERPPVYNGDEVVSRGSKLREITVSDKCTLCGLCDQKEFQDIFAYDAQGKLIVQHGGIVDVEKYPKVLELMDLCPSKAIQINTASVFAQNEAGDILEQFNQLVNVELRDFSFAVPDYYDYGYKSETYQALPVPAKYRSERKYLTDETAESAGITEFRRAVHSQAKNIVKQYVTGYRVKVLAQFYMDEGEDNYYFKTNREVSALLEKAYQLAKAITGNRLAIPDSFCVFNVKMPWNEYHFSREKLENLEDIDIDLSRSGYFHDSDYYRTWVSTDGDFKNCYYDFTEAEKEFRDDIDRAVEERIKDYVAGDVEYLTGEYIKRAKKELSARLTQLQAEVKKYANFSSGDRFQEKISELCKQILAVEFQGLSSPWLIDFDDRYNDDYRFYSERECEKAAENRRERAYNDGRHFLENLPRAFNDKWEQFLSKFLNEWKRKLLGIYDMTGQRYPNQGITIQSGNHKIRVSLETYDDIGDIRDDAIYDYVKENMVIDACYGSIDGVSYMSEYDCDITTDYDCDFRSTLFGDIKEVNKRYGYIVNLYVFCSSANKVSAACCQKLNSSEFLKSHFTEIQKQLVSEIHRVTGV